MAPRMAPNCVAAAAGSRRCGSRKILRGMVSPSCGSSESNPPVPRHKRVHRRRHRCAAAGSARISSASTSSDSDTGAAQTPGERQDQRSAWRHRPPRRTTTSAMSRPRKPAQIRCLARGTIRTVMACKFRLNAQRRPMIACMLVDRNGRTAAALRLGPAPGSLPALLRILEVYGAGAIGRCASSEFVEGVCRGGAAQAHQRHDGSPIAGRVRRPRRLRPPTGVRRGGPRPRANRRSRRRR